MSACHLDQALEVLKLNTLISPENGNAWDSLAECCLNLERYAQWLEGRPTEGTLSI
jgi:hypothetical protein